MKEKRVTVICISYNHKPYVYKALASLQDQQYDALEVFIADDASTDGTQQEILRFLSEHPHLDWQWHFNEENIGNCKTFNLALQKSSGDYIIDLSADDWISPGGVKMLVEGMEKLPPDYGVVYGNVELVDAAGHFLSMHYPVDANAKTISKVPQGNVYAQLVKRYCISPVGMMTKKTVLQELGGYDETLAYEDFDFWIRSSRNYKYGYVDHKVAVKRKVSQSLSARFYTREHSPMFESTARVCEKIAWLNQTDEERQALLYRIRYEFRQAIRFKSKKACIIYVRLQENLKEKKWIRFIFKLAAWLYIR